MTAPLPSRLRATDAAAITERVVALDPQGSIAQVWSKVRPGAHAADVLAAVRRHSGVVELSGQRAETEVPTAPPS